MLRMFIGEVISVDEDTHVINFSIDDFANTNNLSAIPFSTITSYPEKEDEVLILQPNPEVEIFYYTQMPKSEEKNIVQLKYGNSVIKLEKSDNSYITTIDTSDNSSIVLKKSKITFMSGNSKIEMTNDNVLINDHLKVT